MSGIEIDQVQTEEKIKSENESECQPEPDSQDQPEPSKVNEDLEAELQVKLQPILLDSAITALGNTLQKLTSLEDMNFSQDERQALVEAWSPLLPSVSPMTNAVLVTVIILSGKGLLYMACKKKLSPESKALPVESSQVKEAVS